MTSLRSVPRNAIALGTAIGLCIVGIAVKLVSDLHDESWTAALRNSNDVAASVSHDLQRSLETYDLSLRSIVFDLSTAGVMELAPDVRDRVLFDSSTKARHLGPILVLDSHGSVFIESDTRVPRPQNFATFTFFKFHKTNADDALHIGHPFKAATGEYRVTLSRRLTLGDGDFAGVVVGTIDLAYFEELFSKIDLGSKSALSLTLTDGTMLMRTPLRTSDIGRDLKGTMPFEKMLLADRGTLTAHAAIDGVERQYVFQRIGTLPLVLAVAQSTETIDDVWRGRAWLVGLMTALLLLGCGTLALILRRELARRAEVERELFAQGERLAVTLSSIGDAVVATDRGGNVLYMNPIAERMSGWTATEARGRPLTDVVSVVADGDAAATAASTIDFLVDGPAASTLPTELTLRQKNGGTFAVEHSVAPIRDRDGATVGAVMVLHDVTEARSLAQKMSHVARHDPLTDLPNRVLFQERLAHAIERAGRDGRGAAVLYLDLDRFKPVNDSFGHRVGDRLLVETADRLRACVRDIDTACRHGGDEFVVLLADLDDVRAAERVASAIVASLAQPFTIEGHEIGVTASVGVAVYPNDGTDGPTLVKNADQAMYQAKHSGRDGFRFFTSELGDMARRRLDVERRFEDALAADEFVVHYQPLCRASDGRAIGAEALVRWARNGTIALPATFISIAEDCGQIVALGERVLRIACRDAARWNAGRPVPFPVSVNVSAHQFTAAGFVDRVRRVLDECGLDPSCLELEITESILLAAVDRTDIVLRDLKALGISIALDDFGTGYSSLSYLSRFPVDRIKIDQSFVHDMTTSPRTREVVRAMIRLGHDLGLNVTAEGVETAEQRAALVTLGCRELQGFLLGVPSPACPLVDDVSQPIAHEADAV